METIGGLNMKKIFILLLSFVICVSHSSIVFAEDFSNREDEMNEKCAAIYNVETQQECEQYQAYLEKKNNNLDNEIKEIQQQIAKVDGNIDSLTRQVSENTKQLKSLTTEIAQIQVNIDTANRAVTKLNNQIETKEKDIEKRDKQMKKRLVELQVYSGSNNLIDFLMGASSFADLLRRSEILGELNSYENDQILQLLEEKEKLKQDKKAMETQQKILKTQEENLQNSKKRMEELNKVNEQLIATYRKKEQTLMNQKVAAQRKQSNIPKIDTSLIPVEVEEEEQVNNENTTVNNQQTTQDNNQQSQGTTDEQGNTDDSGSNNTNNNQNGNTNNNTSGNTGWKPSSSLIVPIIGNWYYSAGTWEYPNDGGMHLGMDFATGNATGLQVVAPANGIVIWAYNGCDNNGYLGNTCGNPISGGNTVVIVVRSNKATYAISFSHLTSASVSIGSMVTQGQVIGYTGNSGNSTGPHCHVEVIYLGNISLQEAVTWYNTGGGNTYAGDTTFGAGWDSPNACGNPPCRLRPESFWLS